MKTIQFWYQFHAVGQGLFASGHLYNSEARRQFNWVFDCGTSSRRAYVQREITRVKLMFDGKAIGLFCLSHFDEDHINGARELLSQQRVDVLVMPYFPFVERIRIALATPRLSDDYLRFLVDPAGYMFAAAGENLREVIFIAGGGAPPEESAPQNTPDRPDDDWQLNRPDTEQPEPPAQEDIHGVSDQASWRAVRVFGHQKPFTVGGFWEFLFFNEKIPDSKAANLRQQVAMIVKKFRRADGSFDGTSLLGELKPLFVQTFGSSGIAQNSISLIAYCGPVAQTQIYDPSLIWGLEPAGFDFYLFPSHDLRISPYSSQGDLKVSIGYFGDFPLTSPGRVEEVRRHFGHWRWNRLQIIQVPHHGSHHSWYNGASGEFQHRVSVISSARHSDHHPSQSVLDDLATHGVILVNEMQRGKFYGQLYCQ